MNIKWTIINSSLGKMEVTGSLAYSKNKLNIQAKYSAANTFSSFTRNNTLKLLTMLISKGVTINKREAHVRLEGYLPFSNTFLAQFVSEEVRSISSSSTARSYLLFSVDLGF